MTTHVLISEGAQNLVNPIIIRVYDPTPRFRKGGLVDMAEQVRRGGEMGDDFLIHVNRDEFKAIKDAWGEPTYNDSTGLPEYGLKRFFKKAGKTLKKVAKVALPIALNMFLPGVGGLVANAALGAISAKKSGGNPLLGAASGALSHGMGGGGKGLGALGFMPGESGGIPTGGGTGALSKIGQFFKGTPGVEVPAEGGMGPPEMSGGSPGIMGKFKNFFTNQETGKPAWGKIAGAGAGALALLGSMGGKDEDQAQGPIVPSGWNDPAKQFTMNRERQAPLTDYANYGKLGGTNQAEHQFFAPATFNELLPETGTVVAPDAAQAPNPEDILRALTGGHATGGSARGPGSGREDKIEALLSDGEYVVDAESVALLGDGSLDEGARRLDEMRANLRAHKGKALAKGEFSPAAKDPAEYMAKGGRMKPTVADRAGSLARLQYIEKSLREGRDMPLNVKTINVPFEERQATERMLGQFRARKRPGRAKGGRMKLVPGGMPKVDLEVNEEKLAALERFISAYKEAQEQAGYIEPGAPVPGYDPRNTLLDPAIRAKLDDAKRQQAIREAMKRKGLLPVKAKGGRVNPRFRGPGGEQLTNTLQNLRRKQAITPEEIMAGKQRVEQIAALMKVKPIQKAEGGPVGELTAFADRLEAALRTGNPPSELLAEGEALIPKVEEYYAKGGIVRPETISEILKKYQVQNRSPETFRQMADELRRLNPDSKILEQYESAKTRKVVR